VAPEPRIAFAGDRPLAVRVLDYLIDEAGVRLVALLLPSEGRASHDAELLGRCPDLGREQIFRGRSFAQQQAVDLLDSLNLDFLISVHFPHLFPVSVLRLPRRGCLNVHPALLPHNRGWHTASWALLEDTPLGATVHFMDEGVDTGDIVHQVPVPIGPGDTAETLYPRVFDAEFRAFQEAWPSIVEGSHERRPQSADEGSAHQRDDLAKKGKQRLHLDEELTVEELLRRLRAFTTSRPDEACYYEVDGRRYRVRVSITEEATKP
jgi:methionyl-tRNA formyltransferase